MDEISLSRQEMSIYCKYLTGLNADEQCLALFYRAIQHEETVLNDSEIKLLQLIIRNPSAMGLIDSALGMFDPGHPLRKRMVIAFAILETSPVYFEFFKPKVFSRWHIFTLIAKGIQEAFQAVAGSIILTLI
jgi:hypothetical protein